MIYASLDSMAETLSSLSTDTENDFLNAGNQIRSVSSRCKTNAANSAAIRESLTTEQTWNSDEVSKLFSHAYEEMREDTVIFAEALPGLHALETRAQHIREVQNFLWSLTHAVKILGGQMKFNNAQSGQTNSFQMLADAAKNLAGQVSVANSNMYLPTISTTNEVRRALRLIKNINPFRTDLNLNKQETGVFLHAISGMAQLASESCQEIEEISQEIAPALTQVVMSLQYHDITRQQMEHVGAAVLLLPESLKENGNIEELSSEQKLWCSRVIDIQLGQLQKVLITTDEIALDINDQFRTIFRQTRIQTEEAGQILGQETDLVLAARQLRISLQKLLVLLSNNQEMAKELTDNLFETREHLEFIGDQLRLVEDIGLELKLLSINAMLQEGDSEETKHSPETEILIKEIIHIAGEAQELLTKETNDVQDNLTEVIEFQQHLEKKLDQRLKATVANRKVLTGYLNTFIESSKNMIQAMREVSFETKQLEEAIINLLEELSFEHVVHLKVGKIMRAFETLSSNLKDSLKEEELTPVKAEDFEQIRSHYTREIERQIHDTCLDEGLDEVYRKIKDGWKEEIAPAAADAGDDLFDDDIELF